MDWAYRDLVIGFHPSTLSVTGFFSSMGWIKWIQTSIKDTIPTTCIPRVGGSASACKGRGSENLQSFLTSSACVAVCGCVWTLDGFGF